jgi:hypothetical protein
MVSGMNNAFDCLKEYTKIAMNVIFNAEDF